MSNSSRQSMANCTQRLGTMHELMEEVMEIQREGGCTSEAVVRVKEIVDQSESLIEETRGASEMLIDAKILAASGTIIKHHVQDFDPNLKTFSPDEYAAGLIAYLETNSVSDTHDWDILAAETFSMFKKVPPLSYKLGTFKLDPPPPPEKIKPERQKKTAEAAKSVIAAADQTADATTAPELTDEIYQHILKCLVICFRRNQKQPINYFKFVIHPTDFWTTVQNIFHFSFLVRDGKVKMSLNDTGVPVVEPLLNRGNADEQQPRQRRNSQFTFRITPVEWKELIKVFEVTQACITPM